MVRSLSSSSECRPFGWHLLVQVDSPRRGDKTNSLLFLFLPFFLYESIVKPPKRAQQATFDQEPPHHWDNDDEGSDDQHNQQNNNWDADYTMEEQEGENSLDEEGSANQKVIPSKSVSAAEFFKHQSGGTAQRKRRKQKGEGMSSDEDDTDDEDFEYGQTAGSRKRAAPKSQSKSKVSLSRRFCSVNMLTQSMAQPALHKSASGNSTVKATGSSSGKKESSSSKAQATAAAATRKQCTGTLVKVLEPVFAPSAGNAAAAHTRAEEFAHEVEAEVFEHFAEPDGQPKQKYLAKIRQLLFNLKNSELLRNRVALGRIPPSKLANLSMDDLLTPEQRAMADSVRAKSLKDSVKQDVDANQPRIRMTHKGQEVVGEDQSSARTFGADAPRSPDKPSFDGDLPSARSASREDSQGQSPPAPTRDQALSPNTVGPHARSPTGEEAPVRNSHSPSPPSDRDGSPATSAQTSPRVEEKPKPKVQFDFDSVWGSLQSPPMGSSSQLDTIGASGPESPIDVTQARTEAGDDDYDPFDFGKADDVPTSTTPPMSPSPTAPPSLPPAFREPAPDPCVAIQGFSQVWSGDISMPEEGGFPARAVQVGGRPLGDAPLVWQSLVPSRMAIEGRLPTKNATDYLVQCSFAPTREIVVLALLPNAANGVTLEQAQEKQQYFIDMFVRRDRNGVVPPAPHRRQLVKDCYIVPLKASEENLPEYVELLDEHALGDKGERKSDLLLAVFVLQKGLIPSAGVYNPQSAALPLHTAPTPLPSLTQGHTPVPGFGSPLPSTSGPPLPTSSLAGISEPLPAAAPPPAVFDPAALSSLIGEFETQLLFNVSSDLSHFRLQTLICWPRS